MEEKEIDNVICEDFGGEVLTEKGFASLNIQYIKYLVDKYSEKRIKETLSCGFKTN